MVPINSFEKFTRKGPCLQLVARKKPSVQLVARRKGWMLRWPFSLEIVLYNFIWFYKGHFIKFCLVWSYDDRFVKFCFTKIDS